MVIRCVVIVIDILQSVSTGKRLQLVGSFLQLILNDVQGNKVIDCLVLFSLMMHKEGYGCVSKNPQKMREKEVDELPWSY